MEAQAQMKYHHSERCFTYRMKRPMVFLSLWLRAFRVWEICESIQTTLRWLLRQSEDPTVVRTAPTSLGLPLRESCFETSARWGVWLGRHICYTTTQVSQGVLSGNRNLTLRTSVKARLINDFQYESRLRKQGQRSFGKYGKYEQIIPEVSE